MEKEDADAAPPINETRGITNKPELIQRPTGDNSNCIFFDKTI